MTVEDSLRDALRNTRTWVEGVPPEAHRLDDSARRGRQRRRKNVAAMSTLALLAVSGVAVVTLAGEASDPGGAVAWKATPANRAVLADGAEDVPAPTCEANSLTPVTGLAGAFHGRATQQLQLMNTGTDICSVVGTPKVLGVDAVGATHDLRAALEGADDSVNVPAGGTATAMLGALGTCTGAGSGLLSKEYSTLKVTLPTIGGWTFNGTAFNPSCGGVTITPFIPDVVESPMPTEYSGLTATLTAPTTANAGTALAYIVTLKNERATPIGFDSCPAFDQHINVNGSISGGTFVLNCDPGSSLLPGESQAYEMRLDVQPGAAGAAKLAWVLDGGASAGTVLQVN